MWRCVDPRVNQLFGGTYHLNLHGRKIRELGTSVSRAGGYVPPKSWLTRGSTPRHIPEDDILHPVVFILYINFDLIPVKHNNSPNNSLYCVQLGFHRRRK
jgi:hypothetical protein